MRITPADDDEEDKDEEAHPPTGEPSETDGKENKKDKDPSEEKQIVKISSSDGKNWLGGGWLRRRCKIS